MSTWTKLWLAWLAAFFLIEIPAAKSHDPNPTTLSEHVWTWEGLKDTTARLRWLRLAGAVFFLAWLVVHFLSGRAFFWIR